MIGTQASVQVREKNLRMAKAAVDNIRKEDLPWLLAVIVEKHGSTAFTMAVAEITKEPKK